MRFSTPSVAPGVDLFPSLKPPQKTITFHQITVLIITFLAYASFHASRKPPSIVKSVLGSTIQLDSSTFQSDLVESNLKSNATGWPPFNGPEGNHRLGELDLAFLSSYSIGMYFAGHAGDRMDLRLLLVFGMILCGLFQSVGWPCVVAVVGNWFGKDKRGLIMGIWNSHTSVGNIIGSVLASAVLDFGWGWSFVVPGFLVILLSVFVFLFLVVSPEDIGFKSMGKELEMGVEASGVNNSEKVESEEAGLLGIENSDNLGAIGFLEAWRLPGVVPFAFCLFFSKLVAYTFLYWLPFYLRHTAVAGVHLSHKTAGILSTVFDIGGVLGGILAGFVSDIAEARAITSVSFLVLSIPALFLYRVYGSLSMISNISLMFISGLLVNGPYSLITTAVAADLGTQDLIKGNSRALATVTAIIDGTGSVGAALGPLLAGYISTRGWNSVFFMLIISIFFASLCLIRVVKSEIKRKLNDRA
uniref:Glycerol-3-phosphate transporter family protein n=1 Tax=Rhizophora mucronata TaxID=61149 RepID=A0A2P2IQV5_RHIMU